jgi:LruC domain-containing protein
VIQAVGAGFTNGFGFELPVDPSLVESISGLNYSENYLSIATNGTESDQQSTVIIPFDNAKNVMGVAETFINTQPGETYYEPVAITNIITFNTPVNTGDLGTAPYNPFIIANSSRGYEIHLPGQTPTAMIDETLYGNAFDDSRPSQGKYFQSENNLPWAINIPVRFNYPKEKASIESAHLKFANWAESGGAVFQDWYIDNSGYRNNSNIYTN